MYLIRPLLLLLILLTLTGCASVSLVSSRKEPAAAGKNYRNFLVVGITENWQRRQIFEEVLSGELRKKGLVATPSYKVTGVEEKLSRELIVKAVQKTRVDAVITTRIVDTQQKKHTDVGYVMTDRGINAYADIYGSGTVSYAVFDMKPVEITTSTTFILGSDLFDTASEQRVWTGTTNAVDPKGVITVSEKFAGVVINTLSKEGLIQ